MISWLKTSSWYGVQFGAISGEQARSEASLACSAVSGKRGNFDKGGVPNSWTRKAIDLQEGNPFFPLKPRNPLEVGG